MTPTSTEETPAQKEVDRKLGHALFSLLGEPKILALALALGWGGREGFRAFVPSGSDSKPAIERTLEKVSRDICEIKVMQKAMLDVMPAAQRERANRLIAERMEVLALAGQQSRRSQP